MADGGREEGAAGASGTFATVLPPTGPGGLLGSFTLRFERLRFFLSKALPNVFLTFFPILLTVFRTPLPTRRTALRTLPATDLPPPRRVAFLPRFISTYRPYYVFAKYSSKARSKADILSSAASPFFALATTFGSIFPRVLKAFAMAATPEGGS